MKHTPEPWKLGNPGHGCCAVRGVWAGEDFVADVGEEVDANLIVSAPQLLKRFKSRHEEMCLEFCAGKHSDECLLDQGLINRAGGNA